MKKYIIAVLITLFAVQAFAARNHIGWRSIKGVHAYKTHTGLLYQMDYMIHNGCTKNYWYILPKNHPYYAEIKEMMLLARSMNRKVAIALEGCHEGYPIIRDAYY